MAQRGRPAFDKDAHRRLKRQSRDGVSDMMLAVWFRVSLPTIKKYLSLPLSHKHGKPGRPRKASA